MAPKPKTDETDEFAAPVLPDGLYPNPDYKTGDPEEWAFVYVSNNVNDTPGPDQVEPVATIHTVGAVPGAFIAHDVEHVSLGGVEWSVDPISGCLLEQLGSAPAGAGPGDLAA